MWLMVGFFDIALLSYTLSRVILGAGGSHTVLYSASMPIVATVTIILFTIVTLAAILVRRVVKYDQILEIITVITLAVVAANALLLSYFSFYLVNSPEPRLSLLIILAVLLFGARLLSHERLYATAGQVFLAIDVLFMFAGGFSELHYAMTQPLLAVLLPLGYLAVLILLAWLNYRDLSVGFRARYHDASFLTITSIAYLCLLNILYTADFDFGYPLSLLTMIFALLIVVLGFWRRSRALRLYGLVLTLACVAKLMLLDITGSDLLMRAIAFVAAGLICFGVSALYNFAVKRLNPVQIPAPNSAPQSPAVHASQNPVAPTNQNPTAPEPEYLGRQ
jgi:hypothetical protein